MPKSDMNIRRVINQLAEPGDVVTLAGDFAYIKDNAEAFAKGRRLMVVVEPAPGGATARLIATGMGPTQHHQIAELEMGAYLDIELAGADDRRVRNEASRIARVMSRAFSCSLQPGGILRVTRVDGLARAAASVPNQRYRFDLLAEQLSITISAPVADHHSLRTAAWRYAQRNSWSVTCRVDGETMTIYRTDIKGAEQLIPKASAGRSSSKYDLDRLATVASVFLDLPGTEHHKLRLAVSAKARAKGWKLSCRIEGNGMRVTRTDPAAAPAPAWEDEAA